MELLLNLLKADKVTARGLLRIFVGPPNCHDMLTTTIGVNIRIAIVYRSEVVKVLSEMLIEVGPDELTVHRKLGASRLPGSWAAGALTVMHGHLRQFAG